MMNKTKFIILLMLITNAILSQEKVQTDNGSKDDFIYKNGNVGIGTISPTHRLHVTNSSGDSFVQIDASVNSGVRFLNGLNSYIEKRSGTGSLTIKNQVAGGSLNFGTENITRMNIRPNGNVGIGTTNPNYKLEVNGEITSKIGNDYSIYRHVGIGFHRSLSYINQEKIGGSIIFQVSNNSLNDTKALTINHKGSVGIGTNNPTTQLEIGGDFNSALKIGSSSTDAGQVYTSYEEGKAHLNFVEHDDPFIFKFIQDHTDFSNTELVFHNGNVGIGADKPFANLHIKTNDNNPESTLLRLDNSGEYGHTAGIEFYTSTTDAMSSHRAGRISARFDGNSYTNARLSFYSMTSGNKLVETIVLQNGNVGIGTTNTKGFKLAVKGKIGAEEIQVHAPGYWPDYVFSTDYNLKPLSEVESFIEQNNHLPDIPSEKEVKEKGINLGDMDAKLLQKIEELTLYMIEQNKDTKALKQENNELKNTVSKLIERIKTLEEK